MIMDQNEDQDELIDEIDILYNGELSEELFVMQYPLRPSDMPYQSHAELSNLSLNTDNSNLKLTYTLDSKMKNFDQQFSNTDYVQNLIGQKIDANTNYCIGVYKNNILYLNPVSNFMQFRNDFSHMETNESKKKKAESKLGLNNLSVVTSVSTSQTHSRRDSISQGRETSLLPEKNENDPKWQAMKFYKPDTIQSYQIKDKLYFDDNIKYSKANFVDDEEYFDFLFSNVNREPIITRDTASYRNLMKQPLNVRIEFFMKKLHIVNYYKLKEFCKYQEETRSELFLETVLRYARILKNGHFILKSECRYDPNTKSDMCTKRNYLINIIQNSKEGVKKNEIKFLHTFEINEILSEIAISVNGAYMFKEMEEVVDFLSNKVKSFKTVYEKEVNYWNSINLKSSQNVTSNTGILIPAGKEPNPKLISNKLENIERTHIHSNNIMKAPKDLTKENLNLNVNPTNNNRLDNGDSNNDTVLNISTVTDSKEKFNKEFIKATIKNTFASKLDVVSCDFIIIKFIESMKLIDPIEINELKSVVRENINNLCIEVNQSLFLRDVGDKEVNEVRAFLIEFLRSKGNAKKSEIKSHLISSGLNPTDSTLNKVMKSIGNYSANTWSLKEVGKS
jgi:hypothetical protein